MVVRVRSATVTAATGRLIEGGGERHRARAYTQSLCAPFNRRAGAPVSRLTKEQVPAGRRELPMAGLAFEDAATPVIVSVQSEGVAS